MLLSVWVEGAGLVSWVGLRFPGCFFWVLPKTSIPKLDQYRKDIIQRESLGTDMLLELKNNNYTEQLA